MICKRMIRKEKDSKKKKDKEERKKIGLLSSLRFGDWCNRSKYGEIDSVAITKRNSQLASYRAPMVEA